MFAHTLLHKTISFFVVIGLLLTPTAPGTNAQDSRFALAMQTVAVNTFADSPVMPLTDASTHAILDEGMPQALIPLDGIVQVAGGYDHTCALTTAGGVKCWGFNSWGQLGDGSTESKSTPVDVIGLNSGVTAIAAGGAGVFMGSHTCALTTTGRVKCWGANSGTNTPVDVEGLGSGVTAITAGTNHTCALTTAGKVKCWGTNDHGQLGDGTTTTRETPVDVVGLESGVVAITARSAHTCALTTAGAAKCWGYNVYGQLGDGSTTDKSIPVDVVGLGGGVAAIVAGGVHTCALTIEGGVKCWGWNANGQLGDGSTVDKSTSVNVVEMHSDMAAIAAGSQHTCALNMAGGIKCWGFNWLGALGDDTQTNKNTPVDVVGLNNGVAAIAAGNGHHTCALTTAGRVKCWGYNYYGPTGRRYKNIRPTLVDVLVQGTGVPTLPPLLVVHGIQLFGDGYRCADAPWLYPVAPSTLGDLPDWFTQDYQVWIAYLDSKPIHTPSIETNAKCLSKQVASIYEQSGHQKITIIAHSMGGLVSRACLSEPDCRDKVEAVYTLGHTPWLILQLCLGARF